MAAHDKRIVPLRELVALLGYAVAGAVLAAAVLGAAIASGWMSWPRAHSAAPSAAPRADTAATCALHASPAACDDCMALHCLRECQSCASSPDCLDLFLCAMECSDPGCENECAALFPAGRQRLATFVGERGCLPMFCRDACSGGGSRDASPAD